MNNQISTDPIWMNEGHLWCRKCPQCSKTLSYKQKSHCTDLFRKNKSCVSCSKSGRSNPNYGKPLSLQTKLRIGRGNTGKVRTDEVRRQISQTKQQNVNGLLSQNGTNQYAWKSYTFPSGRTENVQGYEPWTLEYLLGHSIKESDIIIKGRPIISYDYSGSRSRYLPDCYVSSSNTIVETKSPWTWNLSAERNMAKVSSSLDAGYNVRLILWARYHRLVSDMTYTLVK